MTDDVLVGLTLIATTIVATVVFIKVNGKYKAKKSGAFKRILISLFAALSAYFLTSFIGVILVFFATQPPIGDQLNVKDKETSHLDQSAVILEPEFAPDQETTITSPEVSIPSGAEVPNVTFDITHYVDVDGVLLFKAITNAPEDTELFINLKYNEDAIPLESRGDIVKNNTFLTEGFSRGGKPHFAGHYTLYIQEAGMGLVPESEHLFKPFYYKFTLQPSKVTPEPPKPLTDEQKRKTLAFFTEIISTIKDKRQEIQNVRNTQPMGRGESGSIYLAKWISEVQKWYEYLLTKGAHMLGKGMKAPYCSEAAFNTRVAMGSLSLLGVGYISGDAKIQEKNLNESIDYAEEEIMVCLEQLTN